MVAKLKTEKAMDQKEAFTKSAEIWKGMSDTDKEPYQAKSKVDEERYKTQLADLEANGFFTCADGTKSSDIYVDPKKKYGDDCMLPKRPLSAYLFYTTENVNKLKNLENCSHTDAMKKCGQLWNALDDDGKQKYNDMHDNDGKRYKQQMNDLDVKGFFILADGSKSSDHKAAPKAKKRAKKGEEKPEKAKKQKKE